MFLWKAINYVSADDVIFNLTDPAWVRNTQLARDVSILAFIFSKTVGMLVARSPCVGVLCFVDAVVSKGRESHGAFLMSWEAWP